MTQKAALPGTHHYLESRGAFAQLAQPAVYFIKDLDALFGFKVQRHGGSWWVNNWREMVEKHGFPQPIPGMKGTALRWSQRAVKLWLAEKGGAAAIAQRIMERARTVTVVEAPPLGFNDNALKG